MLIYKLSQSSIANTFSYNSCVVIAPTEERAKVISIRELSDGGKNWPENLEEILCEFLGGSSLPEQLVIASRL